MTRIEEISRRDVLAGLGGLSFCFALGGAGLLPEAQASIPADAKALGAWVRIAPNGAITIFTPGAEMGQGSMTSLALILAEELDADWSKVSLEWAPTDPQTYGYTDVAVPAGRETLPLVVGGRSLTLNKRSMMIVGSRAVMMYYNDLRLAGAQVRKVLLQNAAQKWGVDAGTLRTEPSVVVNPANGARLAYGEIAAFGTVPSPLPAVDKRELKDKAQFRLIGKDVPRRDTPLKVNGSARYGIDVRLPGMVYATVLHSPVHRSAPDGWNDAEIKRLPGVIATVRLPYGVAVAAERFEQAIAARNALEVTWKPSEAGGYNSENALAGYVKIHDDPKAQAQPIEQKGDVAAAFAGAAKTYKAEFRSDYGYHAQMEPMNAVARVNGAGDKIEIWEGSQSPDTIRNDVASAFGLKPEQVTVNQCFMGGAFGRRSVGDNAVECARIAKEVGRPVKLIWTREEDLAQGMFRPQSYQCLEAATDASGKVTGWKHCVVGDGGFLLITGIKIPYYEVPNQFIERRGVSHGVQVFFWRAVGHIFNVFAIESLVDQMAADAKMDPIDFRFERMSITPRARKCFETVAQMCDWKAPRPEGRALGLSITERSGSLGAGVVEVSLDRQTGKIKVHKVWAAIDGGTIVTPAAARANIESAIIYGLSGTLHERATLKDGVVEQSNFHDYSLLRMSDMPEEIHVRFVEVDRAPSGLGEIGNPFIAGAISNAVYRLTGKRLRHMPFTPDRVLETLKA